MNFKTTLLAVYLLTVLLLTNQATIEGIQTETLTEPLLTTEEKTSTPGEPSSIDSAKEKARELEREAVLELQRRASELKEQAKRAKEAAKEAYKKLLNRGEATSDLTVDTDFIKDVQPDQTTGSDSALDKAKEIQKRVALELRQKADDLWKQAKLAKDSVKQAYKKLTDKITESSSSSSDTSDTSDASDDDEGIASSGGDSILEKVEDAPRQAALELKRRAVELKEQAKKAKEDAKQAYRKFTEKAGEAVESVSAKVGEATVPLEPLDNAREAEKQGVENLKRTAKELWVRAKMARKEAKEAFKNLVNKAMIKQKLDKLREKGANGEEKLVNSEL